MRPYRGIRPYRYVDHPIFFAREEEARDLLRLVVVYRGVMLYGESGSGKSSLVNAGLISAAMLKGFQVEYVRVQPREHEELVVERIPADESGGLLPSLFARADGAAPRTVISTADFEARIREGSKWPRPLLVFDQFEELVTHFEDATRRELQRRIVDLLTVLLHDDSLPVKVLLAFREDYLATVMQLLAAVPELVDQGLRLTPPAPETLTTIIRGPFDRYPRHFEHELTPRLAEHLRDRLADRFGSGEVSLSEVQTVCDRLWQSDDPETLLAERGVQGLLEDYLGEELDHFPAELKHPAVALLGQMVTASGTRNVISAEDLITRARDEEEIAPDRLQAALERLEGESKLVRRERRRDLYLYEITSEFLVPWISRRREDIVRLQDRRRERRRLLILGSSIGGLLAILAVVSLLAVWALGQRSDAKHAAADATSLVLASASNAQLDRNLHSSLLLALEANRLSPSPEARASMIGALDAVQHAAAIVVLRHDHMVRSVAFSPDGHTLVSGSFNGTVQWWDLRRLSGKPLGTAQMSDSTRPVMGIAFDPTGDTFFLGSGDFVRRWEADAGGAVIGVPARRAKGGSSNIALSPDGSELASGSGTLVALWETDVNGVARRWSLRGSSSDVTSVAFSPDGRTLAAGGIGAVQLWDVRSRKPLGPPLIDNASRVTSLAFSPTDGHILAWGDLSAVRLWDVRRRKPLGPPLVRGGDLGVTSVAFSPDGRELASGSFGRNTVQLWDVRTRKMLGSPLQGHTGGVTSVVFSRDGRFLASASTDKTVRVWDVGHLGVNPIASDLRGHSEAATSIAFSPDGRILASGSNETLRLWDARSGKPHGPPLRGHRGTIYSVAFSPDGRTLASNGADTVRLWNARTGKQLGSMPRAEGGLSVAFSPDGATLASGGDGTVQLWDVRRRKPLGPPLEGHSDDVTSLAFSPDGRTLASTSFDGTLLLWDVRRGKALGQPLFKDPNSTGVISVAFSPDGRMLASGSSDGRLRLWDPRSRKSLGPPLRARTGDVTSLAFSPDGRILASGSSDKTVRLWDTPSQKPAGALRTDAPVTSLAFSPNGHALASGTSEGIVRLWERHSVAIIRRASDACLQSRRRQPQPRRVG